MKNEAKCVMWMDTFMDHVFSTVESSTSLTVSYYVQFIAEVFKVWDCGPPLKQSLENGASAIPLSSLA